MKTQKIKIKNGKVYGSGNYYRLRLNSGEIISGRMEPTFGYKLRRLFRRIIKTANAQIDKTITIAALPEMVSAEPPEFYIGLEDCVK